MAAHRTLSRAVRLYVNGFQPSMKRLRDPGDDQASALQRGQDAVATLAAVGSGVGGEGEGIDRDGPMAFSCSRKRRILFLPSNNQEQAGTILVRQCTIVMGLWLIRGYTARKEIRQDQIFRLLWWCVVAGLLGGRLYFIMQQLDLVQDYLLKPQIFWPPGRAGWLFTCPFSDRSGVVLADGQSADQSPGGARRWRALRGLCSTIRTHWESDQRRYHRLSRSASLVHGV